MTKRKSSITLRGDAARLYGKEILEAMANGVKEVRGDSIGNTEGKAKAILPPAPTPPGCSPPLDGCTCECHRVPGIKHCVPCCDLPHVDPDRRIMEEGPALTPQGPPMKSKFICNVTVTDPDTGLPVDLEIRKLENGAMLGIDASWLETDNSVYSPYDLDVVVEIPDEEPSCEVPNAPFHTLVNTPLTGEPADDPPNPLVIQWTADDNERSFKQGWGLFSSDGPPPRLEICKVDEMDVFTSDDEVLLFLIKTCETNPIAAKALVYCLLKDPNWLAADFSGITGVEVLGIDGKSRPPLSSVVRRSSLDSLMQDPDRPEAIAEGMKHMERIKEKEREILAPETVLGPSFGNPAAVGKVTIITE